MRAVVGLLLSLAGCDYVLGLDRRPDRMDASMDGAGQCLGKFGDLGAGLLQVCLDTQPTAPLVIPSDINTASGCHQVVVQSDQTEVCVFAGTTIGLSTAIVATGPRPLVLVATDAITIAAGGSLDVSSRSIGNEIGAGGQNRCDATQNGESNNNGGAGGAGGSFGDRGGPGGNAQSGAAVEAAGGTPPGVVMLTGVRGGCGGGRGGDGVDAGGGGGAGAGGGAVYLIAGTSIQIAGTILASGGAGLGGSGAASGGGTSGGGGGGSGGLIGLDAPVIDILGGALLIANGAGGGGGGGKEAGADGAMGEEPNIAGSFPYTAAGGKAADGSISGAGGGGGAWSLTAGVQGTASDEAGGGGGGGVGYILVYAPDRTIESTTISPTAGP